MIRPEEWNLMFIQKRQMVYWCIYYTNYFVVQVKGFYFHCCFTTKFHLVASSEQQ